MPGKKQFINPLTRSSESELSMPAPTTPTLGADGAAIGSGEAGGGVKRSKGRDKVFEATHQRFTAWVDKELKRKFDELAADKQVSKSALLDEALQALLHKQERKPYTRQAKAE